VCANACHTTPSQDASHDAKILIDDIEFYTAMKERFGFRGSNYVLKEVFKSMDTE
jgi:hypothetical protein